MVSSRDEFIKYPRTPHLFGSRGTDDDKHLGEAESLRFVADGSLIVEEKIDGTNVGIHFRADGAMALQCRGHLITEGMHPQYDPCKQWASVKRPVLEERLGDRFILFGEWVYARHSVHYLRLPHTSSSSTSTTSRQGPSSAWIAGRTCWKVRASGRCPYCTGGRPTGTPGG